MRPCLNTATTGEYPLRATIDLLAKHGYEGIEIDTTRLGEDLADRPLQDLKAQLDGCGIEPAALMAFAFEPFGDHANEVERVRREGQAAARLGAPILLTYCACGLPEGVSEEEAFERAGEACAAYADAAAENGLAIALEPIGRAGFMPGPDEALRVAEASGRENVGIMMDTFHYYKSEVPMDRVRAVPPEKLLIVHVNDAPAGPPADLKDADRVYPGRGDMPLVEYLSILKHELGYDGFLSIELFNRSYWADTLETIVRQAKEGLDAVLAQV